VKASERSTELRALADQLESLAELEEAAAEAKQRYRDDPSEENKEAHRAAGRALSDARAESRSGPVKAVPTDGVAITPGTVGVQAGV
jgi:hypothetical protein